MFRYSALLNKEKPMSIKRSSLTLVLILSAACTQVTASEVSGGEMRLMYASERTRATLSIVSARADGSDLREHVPVAVARRGEYEPSVSPDGKFIAFTTYRYSGWKIAISDTNGRNVRRLTADPQYVYDASWSPDGAQLVYRRIVNHGGAYFRGNGDIFLINVDGTGNRNITNDDTEHARNPSFAPEGQSIVYDAFVGEQLFIVTVKADGSAKARIEIGQSHAFAPSWSPDGQWIAHLRQAEDEYTDLWVMRPDGSGARNLTQSRAKGYAPIGDRIQHWQYGTSWSPDGQFIAFTADYEEEGNVDIYSVKSDGGPVTRLTSTKGADTHPHWYRAP